MNHNLSILRRALPVLMALCVGFGAMPLITRGATSLQVGSGTGTPSGTLLLPISLATDTTVIAAQFDLTYPAASLASDGAVLSNPGSRLGLTSREISPGVRRVLVYSMDSQDLPSGVLVNLPLRIDAQAPPGVAPVTLTNVRLSNAGFANIASVSRTDGAVTIGSGTGISARFNSVSFGPGAALNLELSTEPGRTYTIQASRDLAKWEVLTTQSFSTGLLRVTDTNVLNAPYKFYRAVLVP